MNCYARVQMTILTLIYIFSLCFIVCPGLLKIRVMVHTRVRDQRNTGIKWSYRSRAKFGPKYWGRIQETWGPTPEKGSLTKVSKFNAIAFSDPKNEAKTPHKEQVLSFANIIPNLPYARVRNEPLFLHNNKARFTPRGRANSLCKRLEIFTCDWPKGSNRSQPLYT